MNFERMHDDYLDFRSGAHDPGADLTQAEELEDLLQRTHARGIKVEWGDKVFRVLDMGVENKGQGDLVLEVEEA